MENFPRFDGRHFTAADPFGRAWHAEFRWMQTGISIRHAYTVDLKYALHSASERLEKVIALPHPALLALTRKHGVPLTDPFCLRIGNAHLETMITTWQDMDKTLITLSAPEMEQALEAASAYSSR